jgi:hypothetical protein
MTAAATTNIITHLSFSRLKALAHSPLALKRYIDKAFEPTAAMVEGTLLDCLLFTPDDFEKVFFVAPDDVKKPTSAQRNAAKPSPATIEQVARYDAMLETINGRQVVKAEQVETSMFLANSVRNDKTVTFAGLLNPNQFSFQVGVEFFYRGFKHRGIKDASGKDRNGVPMIWDLKKMGSRSGESLVASQIRHNMYDLQAAIYCHPFDEKNEPVNYCLIAVDDDGYVTPFRIGRDARERARIQWNRLITAAHQLNMNEELIEGPAFWGDSEGFFDY